MNIDTTNPKDRIGVTKPQLNLVPPALLIWTAKAMENGAAKYGPFNWRDKKVKMTIYVAAALRHLLSLLDGEDTAQDSGLPHAAHAAACMGIILDAKECNCLIDDRPAKGPAADLIERLTVKKASSAGAKKVYISGPMRGIKNFNFPAFHAAEKILKGLGFETFNPARRDEEKYGPAVGQSETGDLADMASVTGFNLREALAADCDWIAKEATAIVVLPGWEKSKGAQAEVALGRAIGLDIVPLADFNSP